jgi:hypothetical protein
VTSFGSYQSTAPMRITWLLNIVMMKVTKVTYQTKIKQLKINIEKYKLKKKKKHLI